MQMFEYESLYNTKMFGKTFHILAAIYVYHVPKVKGDPPSPIKQYFFSFYPVKFQESKYSSQLFDISLFKDS